MANIRQLKRRIKTANNTSKITKAMEMVAASKMIRAQSQALEARPYSEALFNSLNTVATYSDESLHPLLSKHLSGVDVLVVISTEKGLCGSLNTNLLKATLEWIKDHPSGKIIAVGKKAAQFVRLTEAELYAQFTDLPEHITASDVLPITSLLMENFLSQEFRSVDVLYTNFVNTLSQYVDTRHLLPLSTDTPYDVDDTMTIPTMSNEYTFEPTAKEILNQLLPLYVEQTVYHLFLEARASEHSARMVAMKNASENADELVDELKLLFNKSRQAAITAELLDIVTASMTLK